MACPWRAFVRLTGITVATFAMAGAAARAAEVGRSEASSGTLSNASPSISVGQDGRTPGRGGAPARASGSGAPGVDTHAAPGSDLSTEFPRPIRLPRIEPPPAPPPAPPPPAELPGAEPTDGGPPPGESADRAADAPSPPVITTYFNDLEGFNLAHGDPPIVVTFDSFMPGVRLRAGTSVGNHLYGISLNPGPVSDAGSPSAALVVVRASATFTPPSYYYTGGAWGHRVPITATDRFRLPATSCEQILSPGGAVLAAGFNPSLENDDLEIVFDDPVAVVGFDILFQRLDGEAYASVSLFDVDGVKLYEGEVLQPVGLVEFPLAGGSCFVGFSVGVPIIKRIVVDDRDDNDEQPDANIGYDTFRYFHDEREPCGG